MSALLARGRESRHDDAALEIMRAIAGQSTLPIVADLDTGSGNAINVIHAVREYERAGAAAS